MQLEKYRGSRSRYTCPSCGRRNQFVRYIDDAGEYVGDEVGRCNRESSCGYHLTPKEYFERRGYGCSFPEQLNGMNTKNKMSGLNKMNRMNTVNKMNALNVMNAPNAFEPPESFQTIDNSFVVRSCEHNDKNRFLIFLSSFIEDEYIFEMARKYFIGATKDGKTVFWQLDRKGRARTGKIISYLEETGKRDKKTNPNWVHYELKRHKLLPESFQHQLCFFGEHLLRANPAKPVALVEAEKTACIASIFIEDFLWLAVGGKSYLKAEKLQRFGNRKIVLFPDADGFELWEREAMDARAMRLNVKTSRIIEDAATAEEKRNGFDLADYLIKSEIEAQKWNLVADEYNKRVDEILEDADLFDAFNELLDERLALAESEEEALKPENLRILVDYVHR